MFSSLKAKLIGSFMLINILIIASSAFNYIKVSESAGAFADYRQMARTSVNSGVVLSNMIATRMAMKDYLLESSPENIEIFNQRFNETLAQIKVGMELTDSPEMIAALEGMQTELKQYAQGFQQVQVLMDKRNDIVANTLDANGAGMERTLTKIMRDAEERMSFAVQNDAAESLRTLLLARLYTAKFIKTNSQEDMGRVQQEFATLTPQLQKLEGDTALPNEKRAVAELQAVVDVYNNGVSQLYEAIKARNEIVTTQLNVIGRKVAAESEQIQTQARAVQDTLGPEIQSNNENILTIVFAVAVLIVLIGLLVGLLIPRLINSGISGIQSTLREIRSTGRFDLRADDSRKDELGEMAQQLNETLSSIQAALREANAVVVALSHGDFSKRINVQVSGDLDTLKQGVNTSVQSIQHTMQEIGTVMDAMNEGHFDVRIDADVEGEFRKIVDNTTQTMNKLNVIITEVSTVMAKMQQGQFSARVNVAASGELDQLKTNINLSMDALEKAIADITRIVVAQSQGDLTHQITNNYHGQLDTLKQAINSSVTRLSEVVAQALNATHIVAGAADEVARGSMDLSNRVQEQAAALEETSATMDEMNSVVQGNSRNAEEASRVADGVRQKANQGVEVMRSTIEAMGQIQESSHKISEIVNLIDGIAFQTNLLALNAAVEAARAGEHGRGFAVVAGEVRSLAQKSADAAKDIKSLIEESVARIDQGSELATKSGEMLNEINQEIDSFSTMIGDIAQGSSEQAEGVSQVHGAISQIDTVTQQNAALVEETSAAAASMTEQADILREDMGFFTISGGAAKSNMSSAPKATAKAPVRSPSSTATAKVAALPVKASASTAVASKPATSKPVAMKSAPASSALSDDEWDEF